MITIKMKKKIMVIGDVSCGKSSLINLLSLEIVTTTSKAQDNTNNFTHTIAHGPLNQVCVYDTQGLTDVTEFNDSGACKSLDHFLQDKNTISKIVLYVMDNSRPYIGKLNSEAIINIKNKIDQINNDGDYVVFGVVVNKCDLAGMERTKILSELQQKCDIVDNIFFISAHQLLLDNILLNSIDLKISVGDYQKEEVRNIFKCSNYSFTKNVFNGFNNGLIKHTNIRKSKNEDEEEMEIKYDNIFTSITEIIKCSITKKSFNLKRSIEEKFVTLLTTTYDEDAEVTTDEETNMELNIEQNILNLVKQYSDLYDDNFREVCILVQNMFLTYQKHNKGQYNVVLFKNIIEKIDDRSLCKLFVDFIEKHVDNITVGSLMDAFTSITNSGLLTFDQIDKNKIIVTALLKSQELYHDYTFNQIHNINILPKQVKILMKIATTNINTLKLLSIDGTINSNHFAFFNDPQNNFLKFNYILHNIIHESNYLEEKIFVLLDNDIPGYDDFKNIHDDFKDYSPVDLI